ncbi:hypothetical protein N658DRAFT_140508 [Parathielavia hyrcaniae]|uniref:Uncharacterized protein n=1 Tax=Parathielavia hyrcaniae TaxID=113614 RepID=A0AAN6Q0Q1_9PEZI|nr:hypothetical protein N658DRAFT_140508 [Parathielavia hyrcaniae]
MSSGFLGSGNNTRLGINTAQHCFLLSWAAGVCFLIYSGDSFEGQSWDTEGRQVFGDYIVAVLRGRSPVVMGRLLDDAREASLSQA